MKRRRGAATVLLVFAALALPGTAAAAGTAAPEKSLEALLMLRHPGGLNHFVREVSDPTSPRYRQYASVEKLVHRFGAAKADQRTTLAWLAARGLHGTVGPTGTYVTVPILPRRADRLLRRPAGTGAAPAQLGRLVPAALQGTISAAAVLGNGSQAFRNVTGPPGGRASAAPKPPPEKYSSILPHTGTAAGCPAGRTGPGAGIAPPFTPNQYLTAYGHAAMHSRGLRGEGQTVALVEVDGFRHSDIEAFDKCFGARTPPIHATPVAIPQPLRSGTETTLDLEVLSAAAPGLDHIYVYEGVGNEAGIMLSAGSALGSKGHHPDVISISLGICEPGYSGHLIYRRAMDNIFAVAAGAGISVLVAAGDSGSSGCRTQTETETTALPIRTVSLPSSSPYVTAVGGTNLRLSAKNGIAAEIVWNDWPQLAGAGGGGVSLLSPRRPWWQQSPALERFGIGRVVPDIAALADVFPGYAYFCTSPECSRLPQGSPGWTSIGGTSAATPLMAAGIVLANQFAGERGQRPLGFLNPLLYRFGERPQSRHGVFRDVTEGNDDIGALLPANVGGGQALGCCGARPGYDWASGWGSPKVLALARAASRVTP